MQLPGKKMALTSLFSASAVILYILETFIPKPMPWLRFGLGNIFILITLYSLGFRFALLVTLLKSIIGALVVGGLFTPAFLFSISGGLTSLCVMAIFLSLFPYLFSPIGISIWGAITHNLTQLLVASLLFIGKIEVLYLFPFFIILSIITGTITGIITLFSLKLLEKHYSSNFISSFTR
jgi:heptaprenyl diphosphate synthase